MKQPQQEPAQRFSYSYSPNVPELLAGLRCTLAISSFQAGKVVFLSALEGTTLAHLPRNFAKPMGIALAGDKMAIACLDEVIVLANALELAAHYPKKPQAYDGLFLPRATYHTGQLDLHDLEWGADGELLAVNTAFSCIAKIDGRFSFTPVWQPPFISKLDATDRCHLNGMALQGGEPRFATAFSMTDAPQGWRSGPGNEGIVMDVQTGEPVARHLPMPHSPRMFGGELFLLLSATGELVKLDARTGQYDTVIRLDGFARGLCHYGDYAFVGLSRLRKTSPMVGKLDLAAGEGQAGVAIVHLPTGSLFGEVRFHGRLDEIYDVKIIPGCLRPGILNKEKPEYKLGLTAPGMALWARPEDQQGGRKAGT